MYYYFSNYAFNASISAINMTCGDIPVVYGVFFLYSTRDTRWQNNCGYIFPCQNWYKSVMLLTCGLGANACQGAHNGSRCKQINIVKYWTYNQTHLYFSPNSLKLVSPYYLLNLNGITSNTNALVTFQSLCLMGKFRLQTIPQIYHPLSCSGYINLY